MDLTIVGQRLVQGAEDIEASLKTKEREEIPRNNIQKKERERNYLRKNNFLRKRTKLPI